MIDADSHFTAAQIAVCLNVTSQAIRKAMRDVKPAGVRIVTGTETAAWSIEQLPQGLRGRLEVEAVQQRCRNVAALLSNPRKTWEPAIPLDKLHEDTIRTATRLRDALLPWLVRQHDPDLSTAEMEASGIHDYVRYFGNVVTARHWRNLFKRTIQRDNGAEQWNRLEIYLPDLLKEKAPAVADVVSEALDDFAELEDFISTCTSPHDPNKVERAGVWTLALERYRSLVETGTAVKSAARRVRKYLFARAPFLASSQDSLLKQFNYKLAALDEAAGDVKALRDGRENNNGQGYTLPENDRDLLIHRAVFYYRGDIAPAWRDLLRSGFSQPVAERYAGKASKKSHVPTSIMDSVGPEVEVLTVMHRGPRAFDAIKGYVTRSYDGISSLRCISGDDFTLNTYFYVPDGNGWFDLTRGQVILFIDFRSLRILGWALEPRKSYSSLTIRSLCTHVFGEFGVPEVLYFERGIWKTAQLIKGKTGPSGFNEISQGLKEFGVTFKHAIRPRTKVVERIGGMFQDIAEAEPGYCGRDERRDAPESLRREMAQVKARNSHPSKFFYSLDQWNSRIEQLVDQYNAETQQGHILAGMSPDQAFEKHMDLDNPPMQFSAGLRYLLAHDKRVAPVTLNGVTIQIGKTKFNYRGKEIAHLVGKEVLAWFDPENTEAITVTSLDRTNPITVARSENPNALESIIAPGSEILSYELGRIGEQAAHMKTRFKMVKTKFALPQRKLLADAQAVELGDAIRAQKADLIEKSGRHDRQRRRAQKFADETGIAIPENAQGRVTTEEADLLKKILAIGQQPASESISIEGGKTFYNLKPFDKGKDKP